MRFFWFYAWSGVEIFFVISGFVIPYGLLGTKFKLGSYGGFLKRRLVRIEPAYLVSIALIILLNYLSSLFTIYKGDPFILDPVRLALHLGYLVDFFDSRWLNPVYWTLAIELQYYLVIGLLIALWNLKNSYVNVISVVLFLMLSFLNLETMGFLRYTDVFTIGIICAFYKKEWISRNQYFLGVFITAIVIFINHSYVIFTVTLASSLLIAFFDNLSNNRFLMFLGNISYSLYLLHIPIGGRIINLAKRFDLGEFSKTLVILLALAVSILVSWLFYLAIEKPSHKWSKQIKIKHH